MLSALFKRKAHRAARSNLSAEIPYTIECGCGNPITGKRVREAATIRCQKCKAETLIFPTSPLIDLRETIRDGLRHATELPKVTQPAGPKVWRTPLLAAGAALTIIITIFIVILKSSLFSDSSTNVPPGIEESNAEAIAAARQAMAEFDYVRAAQQFRTARAILHKKTGDNDGAEGRWLWQMEQEASAMADQLDISLAEVLEKAAGLSDRAWKEQFAQRYADKTVVFDTLVHDAGSGIFRIEYPFEVGGLPTRIEVHHSVTLRALKVQWPTRLLVGIRLLEARRERGGWLILGKPDAVVLFTEPAFFQASTVPVDAGLAEQLKRQAGWLNVSPP